MAVRITVRDPDNGHTVAIDVEDETLVEEVVESAAKYWNKPTGAYVVRRANTILAGASKFLELNPKDDEVLELIPDPEGG
jgi:hypothetical protein